MITKPGILYGLKNMEYNPRYRGSKDTGGSRYKLYLSYCGAAEVFCAHFKSEETSGHGRQVGLPNVQVSVKYFFKFLIKEGLTRFRANRIFIQKSMIQSINKSEETKRRHV